MKRNIGIGYSIISKMSQTVLDNICLQPKNLACGSVIWLHGLGHNGLDFSNVFSKFCLPDHLPLRFIFPDAPIRPIFINDNQPMRAWYDVYSLDDLTQEDDVGLQEAEDAISQLIQQELDAGIDSRHIVLAGFSQGGAAALYTGLRYQKPLAGIIGLSTYLPLASKLMEGTEKNYNNTFEMNRNTPIFMAHGSFDTVLPLALGKRSAQYLKVHGFHVEWYEYAIAHQVCSLEFNDILSWLHALFC